MPGAVLVSEVVALSSAEFWCVERPILPGGSLKLFAMSWSIVLLESAKIHANIYIYIYIYAQKLQLHIPESEAFLRYCGVQEAI